jgi:arylsulfatase A-like enzyme
LGRIARTTRAALVSPPVVGAAYVTGLAAWSGTHTSGVDSDVGDPRRAEAIEAFIGDRFPIEVTRMKIGVVAMAIALGLVLGLVADVLLRLRHPAPRLARRSTLAALVESALLVAGLHAALVGWGMADSPQLYAERWYVQGGLARTVQVIATDVLRPRGVVLAALALAILYVRPARFVYLAQRQILFVRRPLREFLARIAKRSIVPVAAVGSAAGVLHEVAQPVHVAHAGRASGSESTTASMEAIATAAARSDSGSAPAWASTPPASRRAFGPAAAAASRGSTLPPLAKTKDGKPLNVLILAADSFRADRLDPRVAPNLTKLASRGTRFDRAYVSMPRTFPSWVTILTGRHGHHHGIRSSFPTWEQRAKDFDALPARFAEAGYATAVVSDHAGDIFGRIDLGFARVDVPRFDFRQTMLERETPLLPVLHSHLGRRLFPVMREVGTAADPMLIADDVEAALRSMRKGPFFATVFFSTAHAPYAAPAPYYAKYTNRSYRGRFKYHKPMGLGRAAETAPDAEDLRQIQALYDGAVASVDDAIGRVLAALVRLDLAESTVVVVTADHGETIFDGGRGQGHGDHLFGDEGTHVPLVIYDPRLEAVSARKDDAGLAPKGRCESRLVSDVDLAPTLYELTGVSPPGDLDGRSLAPALRGEPIEERLAYAETGLWLTEEIPGLPSELRIPYPGVMGLTELDAWPNTEIVLRQDMQAVTVMARHRMVRDERWKLVYVPTRTQVRYFLFDTERDPGELDDVAASHPDVVARLRAELWSWMSKDPAVEKKDEYLLPRGAR